MKSTWFVTAIAAAGICLPAGATATGSTSRPLLTFAVGYRFSPGASRAGFAPGGLCASDPQGHIFRVSDPFFDTGPAWSPDGHWIAFSRANDRIFADHVADVFITDAEGRHRRDLTLDKGLDNYGAAWSPDGTKIAYANAWYGSALSVVDAEGGTERRVVEVPYGESIEKPSWSPDGKRLLFTIRSDYEPWASYVIDVDGTNQRKLVDGLDAAWSPDGRQIAYLEPTGPPFQASVAVAQADGSNPEIVARDAYRLGGLAWSPDGRWIAFTHWPLPPSKIALVRPDGSGEHAVPTGDLQAFDPAWRPAAPPPKDRRRCVVKGTSHADVIRGTDRGDLIDGGAGNDTIHGSGGDDLLVGGRGRDRLYGGAGSDLFGADDSARDLVVGGRGTDSAYYDKRLDRLRSVELRPGP